MRLVKDYGWLFLLALAAVFFGYLYVAGEPLRNSVAKDGGMSMQLARDPATLQRIMQSWTDVGVLALARQLVWLDFAFAPLYAVALHFTCHAAAAKFDPPWDGYVRRWVALLPLLAGSMDAVIENPGLLQILSRPDATPPVWLYVAVTTAAGIKWLCVPTCLGFIAFAGAIWAYERIATSARHARIPSPLRAASTAEVLHDELDHLAADGRTHVAARAGGQVSDHDEREAARRAYASNLFGLALSGGGIRSATFGLGVLQALARRGLLPRIDYLSTVSGGGYVGSWLSAWVRRAGGIREVQEALARKGAPVGPVEFLRAYSNYLTPRTGLLGLDTWTAIVTWVRNLSINLVILIGFLWSALALLMFVAHVGMLLVLAVGTLAAIFTVFAVIPVTAGIALKPEQWTANEGRLRPWLRDHADWVGHAGRVLLLLATTCGGFWWTLWALERPLAQVWPPVAGTALVGVAFWLATLYACKELNESSGMPKESFADWGIHLIAVLAGIAGFFATVWAVSLGLEPIAARLQGHQTMSWAGVPEELRAALATALSPLLVALGLGAGVVLAIAILGRAYGDKGREWWARIGGGVLLATLLWTMLAGSSFAIPGFVHWLGTERDGATNLSYLLAAAWAGITAVTGLLARNAGGGGAAGAVRQAILRVGPHLAAAGLYIVAVYWFFELATTVSGAERRWPETDPTLPRHVAAGARALLDVDALAYLALAFGCGAVGLLMSLCADVNLFSLRDFYKNRLVRCYLGATNPDRPGRIDRFTQFSDTDNFPLWHLSGHGRPFHLLNAALNIVHDSHLAWQERKAASFVFSPLYCGYSLAQPGPGDFDWNYRPTRNYADDGQPEGGITLGEAMALSGAALSPNRGQGSTPALTLLMTLLNVRLGAWLPNPRYDVRHSSPPVAARYLVAELFGRTNERMRYVNVSDGGHFENLGVYELVRRRCRTIVVVDAGLDEKRVFDDLGNCIRKCAIDLNVRIELDVTRLIPYDGRLSEAAWASGRILYPSIGGEPQEGVILYLKSSLIEPVRHDAGLLNYLRMQPPFPHHSTLDQWFGESTFESYRALGERLCDAMCAKHKGVLGIG